MNSALTLRPLADQQMDDIRREAIKAIRECLDPLALTGRILRYTDPDERLRFIRAARAYYLQQIDDCKEAGVSHCIDTLVPRLGDLTDYFNSHEKQAEAELRQRVSWQRSAGNDSPYGEPAAKPAQKPTPKQTTTNTPIHMTFYNYGSAQVFESGSNPTINIEQFGAPEQAVLPEEGTAENADFRETTNAGDNSTTRPDGANPQELHGKDPCSEDPIFRYISPFVTDEQERLRIHAVVKNIVSGAFPMAYICGQLKQLVKEQKIALNVSFEDQHNELVRLGLPADRKGFSLQNYKNYI